MKLQDFYYELPDELIARYPLEKRSASRLLVLEGSTGKIQHKQFQDLPSLLSPNDLLVFNNTSVIPARLLGNKASGGRVEMLVERILPDNKVLAHLRASKKPTPGALLTFANVQFEMLGRQNDLFELRCLDAAPVIEVLEKAGQIPIPPYFNRESEEIDKERYQTVYAQHKGSVAAPTAGLHFDDEMFTILQEMKIQTDFVTLHVGAGTFASIRVDDIKDHRMHSEYIEVSAKLCEKIAQTKANGGRVVAVGTTSARSLETASQSGMTKPYSGETDIFIYPGYQFKCVDALITNFHLPESTLIMLVSALAGQEHVLNAYRTAVEHKYRFFSYGDAMFVTAN